MKKFSHVEIINTAARSQNTPRLQPVSWCRNSAVQKVASIIPMPVLWKTAGISINRLLLKHAKIESARNNTREYDINEFIVIMAMEKCLAVFLMIDDFRSPSNERSLAEPCQGRSWDLKLICELQHSTALAPLIHNRLGTTHALSIFVCCGKLVERLGDLGFVFESVMYTVISDKIQQTHLLSFL